MEPQPFDRVLLIGHGSSHAEGNAEYVQFASDLGTHLGVTVQPCFLELAEPSIEEGIRLCVADGARRIAVLPLFLGPAGHQKNDVPVLLAHAREEYPAVDFRYGMPLGAQYQLVRVLEQRAAEALTRSTADIPLHDTAILLTARGSSDPDSNSEVFKLARLLYEGRSYRTVEAAFQKVTPPNIAQGIERCVRLGARRVIVLPYLVFTGSVRHDIEQQAQAFQTTHPEVEILVGAHLFPHAGLTEAVAQRYYDIVEGTAAMTCDLCKYRHRMTGFEHSYGKPQTTYHHRHDPDLITVRGRDIIAQADLRDSYTAGLLVTHRLLDKQRALLTKSVLYHPPVLVVGIGSRRGVSADEVRAAIETTLHDAGLALASVAALATADLKADEPGIVQTAAALGVPLRIIAREQLTALAPDDFSPSAAREQVGLPGVAEPCAVLAAGGERSVLLVRKRAFGECTVAVAVGAPVDSSGMLSLVSIGPGDPQQMTLAAWEALATADVVIGYQTSIDQVRPLLSPQQEIIARPMQSELERAQQAIDLAAAGHLVALISSGDIGMYAMAGPVFELLHQRSGPAPEVQVLPGVSAFQAAAARVGTAINHDLCTISLSNLLIPWALIERRLWAAAEGDFVLALYNPRSKGRDWQLARACDIVRTNHPPDTPVVLARNVTRPDEQIIRTTLAELDPTQADMLTVVLIGNSQSYWSGETLMTPRGYHVQPAPTPSSDAHHPTYPVNLTQMQAAPVVVVGGGLVGERKVRGLLAVGAAVTLISPDATPHLREWSDAGRIQWQPRPYQSGDLAHRPALVFAATNERSVNAQVAQDAAALGLLCNVADAPHEGNFHLPAVYREAGLVVTISTEGISPARARQVRDRLADLLQQEGTHDAG